MTITADQIITLLKTGVYPTPYPPIQYFKYKQKFPHYPSIEVLRTQPDSFNEDVIKRDRNFIFEIRFFVKYIRLPDQEIIDMANVEDTISTLLLNYDFQGNGKIFQETTGWARSDLTSNNNIYGNMSTVRLGIKDVTSTDGTGYVGAYSLLELNSDTTPVQIQILNSTVKKGRNIALHADDSGLETGDPANYLQGDISITYESTLAINTLMDSLELAGNTIKGKLLNGSTIYKYVFLVGDTVTSGGYSEVERATTRFVVNGTWT